MRIKWSFGGALPLAMLLAACGSTHSDIATIKPAPPLPPVGPGEVALIPPPAHALPLPVKPATGLATVWNMRVALNVAALQCRDAESVSLVGGYNAMLRNRKDDLASAEAALMQQYGGTAQRKSYDSAMTRLYNFYAQPFAKQSFCATATRVQRDEARVSRADFTAFAQTALDDLNAPFLSPRRAPALVAEQRGAASPAKR